jgi:hypothetical protein
VEKAVRRGRSSLDRSGYSRKTTGFLSDVWLTGEGVADQPAAWSRSGSLLPAISIASGDVAEASREAFQVGAIEASLSLSTHIRSTFSAYLPPVHLQSWQSPLQPSTMGLLTSQFAPQFPNPCYQPLSPYVELSHHCYGRLQYAPPNVGASDATNVWFVAVCRTRSSRGRQNRFCRASSPYCGASSPCYMPFRAMGVDVMLQLRPSVSI